MLGSFLVHLFHYHPPLFQPRLPVLLFSPADPRALPALDVSTPKNHRLTATGHQTACLEVRILLSMRPTLKAESVRGPAIGKQRRQPQMCFFLFSHPGQQL